MRARAPRHRGEQTSAQRKHERELLLSMAFLLGSAVYLVLLVTVWDRAATVLGIVLCGVIVFGIEAWRDRRRRRRPAEERPRS